MNIEDIKNKINDKLSNRDYYGMFEIINNASNEYFDFGLSDYNICIELINQNQDLYEYMGSSKQFEMAYDLHKTLVKNRNKLYISCLNDKIELKSLFKRCVGDFSTEY
jgi:hypothetical protein